MPCIQFLKIVTFYHRFLSSDFLSHFKRSMNHLFFLHFKNVEICSILFSHVKLHFKRTGYMEYRVNGKTFSIRHQSSTYSKGEQGPASPCQELSLTSFHRYKNCRWILGREVNDQLL